jgi:hypothetical protein
MSGDSILGALLTAARQDGTFGDPHQLATRGGASASVSEGLNTIHNEQTLMAAVGLADRALVIVGHGGEREEDWAKLSELYRGMVASLSDY